MKNLSTLDAITVLDGRYREKVENLSFYLSEKALIKTRFEIEVEYLLFLSRNKIIRGFTSKEQKELKDLVKNFSDKDAERVKEFEEVTRHDVKAVEYLLREKLEKSSLKNASEKAHLFLTSEDINNIAQRINLISALQKEIVPSLQKLTLSVADKAEEYRSVPMLARTHGQSAVGTTVGKELVVFADRLCREVERLKNLVFTGKLNGAVGNYNSFKASGSKKTYKEWSNFSAEFVSQFGLKPSPVTTQINTYEDIIEALQILQRVNGIGVDFAGDMWRYISDGWFVQSKIKTEVGSSTMPQKINPIDFENGEGNLSLSNDLIIGLITRLPVSRLQRDLRDSTQIRNIGLVLGFMIVGLSGLMKGFQKLSLNKKEVATRLNSDWSILSEGAQTWLRVNENVKDPYALFKGLTRGEKLDEKEWRRAVSKLKVSQKAKKAILAFSPENYTGFASEITKETVEKIRKSLKS